MAGESVTVLHRSFPGIDVYRRPWLAKWWHQAAVARLAGRENAIDIISFTEHDYESDRLHVHVEAWQTRCQRARRIYKEIHARRT